MLKTLKQNDDKKEKKPKSFFNKKMIYLLIIIGFLMVVIRIFFLDLWIEKMLVSMGQSIFKARVTIEKLNISLTGGHLRIYNCEIGDKQYPMKNLMVFKLADIDIGVRSLLMLKVHIKNIQLSGLEFGTPRKTSAELKKIPEKKKTLLQKEINKQIQGINRYYSWNAIKKRLGLDSIMDMRSLRLLETINGTSERLQKWPAEFQNQISKPDLSVTIKKIEEKWKNLETTFPKDISAVPDYIKQINQLQNELISFNEQLKQKQKIIEKSRSFWDTEIKKIIIQGERDVKEIQMKLEKIKHLKSTVINDILGPKYQEMMSRIKQFIAIAQRFRKPPPKPPWYQKYIVKGEDIEFPLYNKLPKVWIQYIQCDGFVGKNRDAFIGIISEIASNQNVRWKPTTFHFQTKERKSQKQFVISGKIDLRGKLPVFEVGGNLKGYPLASSYWDEAFLPVVISNGSFELKGKLIMIKTRISGYLDLFTHEIDFKKSNQFSSDNLFHRLCWDVLDAANVVSLHTEYRSGQFIMDSNLDEEFQKGIDRMLESQKKVWMNQIKAEWDREVGSKLEQLNSDIQANIKAANEEWIKKQKELEAQAIQIKNEIQIKQKEAENALSQLNKELNMKQKAAEEELRNRLNDKVNEQKKEAEKTIKNILPKELKW